MTKRVTGLGRGLSALLGEDQAASRGRSGGSAQAALPIEFLRPNAQQPRQNFDLTLIKELAASIREKGVLQPILVRPVRAAGAEAGAEAGAGKTAANKAAGKSKSAAQGKAAGDRPGAAAGSPSATGAEGETFEIIAGERRWRAAQVAGLHEVPVVIRDFSDEEALQIAIIENVQRQDLSPIEEARGYKRLTTQFGHTQNDVARLVGKSRPHVANLLRLLGLPEKVRKMIDSGRLSMGHARALIGTSDPEGLARTIVAKGLNVRQAEKLAAAEKPARSSARKAKPAKDADTLALEADLSRLLGLKVQIDHAGEKGGRLSISYKTLEQLDGLCKQLGFEN